MQTSSFKFIALPLVFVAAACAGAAQPANEDLGETEAELSASRACAGKRVGDTCSLCGPRERNCVETAEVKACRAETSRGRSVLRCRSASAYNPCAGKKTGDSCSVCEPGTGCVETDVLKFCDARGVCSATYAYDPCAGKKTGDSCSLCEPGTDCVETMELKVCDARGACGAPKAYDPCAGKKTGDSCNLCEPGTDCVETMELKVCDARGRCGSSFTSP